MPNINYVVLLMFENRSFDTILGWLYDDNNKPSQILGKPQRPFQGLADIDLGNYRNELWGIPTFGTKKKKYLSLLPQRGARAFGVPMWDPHEDYVHVNKQLFGKESNPPKGAKATMKGFLQDYADHWENWSSELHQSQISQIMETYTPDQLRVINGLAEHYAVSDLWFSSVPTQTNPNRAFFTCGTSLGRASNENALALEKFHTNTFFNRLHKAEMTDWGVFYHHNYLLTDKCYTHYTFPYIDRIPGAAARFRKFDRFRKLAMSRKLPALSFIEAAWYEGPYNTAGQFGPGNDYHPPGDTRDGETLLWEVYDALSNSPIWNETLLVVTFDEHGGNFDHVAPPWGAKPPDSKTSKRHGYGFEFDRFGVRVPALLISPWIQKGTLFRADGKTPYDHTSIMATVFEWQGIQREKFAMGDRVANAPTFEGVLTLDKPRTDKWNGPKPDKKKGTAISITNDTPSQIYYYLGWDECAPVVQRYEGYLQPGQEYLLNPGKDWLNHQYYVAGSFWVGNPNDTPRNLVDGISNRNWRLFWEGWKEIEHGQRLTISRASPQAKITARKGPITIKNISRSQIYYYLGWDRCTTVQQKRGYLQPGQSISHDPAGDWLKHKYYVAASYWVGNPNDTPNNLRDGINWRLFWGGWKSIRKGQILTISQAAPKATITGGIRE